MFLKNKILRQIATLRNIIDFVPLKQSEVYQKIGFTPPEPGDVIFKGFTTQNNTGN